MIDLSVLNPNEATLVVKLISAIVILFLGYIFGRILTNLLKNILSNLEIDRILRTETRFKFKIESRLIALLKYGIYLFTIFLALNQLGINPSIVYIIVFLGVLFVIILIGLNVIDVIPNIISGLKIKHKKIIRNNQYIHVGNFEGTVIHIGLIETRLKHKEHFLIIPNSVITKNKVKVKT
ncbi:MAG: mechanosensitive ion channel [Candidatus Nanoarchaeia archaeon]|nr:mechanosensitive ion channel [Candidatus Nanoarchaeia archaeon]